LRLPVTRADAGGARPLEEPENRLRAAPTYRVHVERRTVSGAATSPQLYWAGCDLLDCPSAQSQESEEQISGSQICDAGIGCVDCGVDRPSFAYHNAVIRV
jgi:hypothetical protein